MRSTLTVISSSRCTCLLSGWFLIAMYCSPPATVKSQINQLLSLRSNHLCVMSRHADLGFPSTILLPALCNMELVYIILCKDPRMPSGNIRLMLEKYRRMSRMTS